MSSKFAPFIWLIIPIVAVVGYPFVSASAELLKILTTVLSLYVLFFSIVVHEVSHGWAAKQCGDSTAANLGRLTLDPIKHVSVVGSIIVPLGLYFLQAPAILGWAKPVPFNPLNFRENPRDQVVVSLAGPLSNFLLAYLCFNLYILAGFLYNTLNPVFPIQYSLDIFEPMVVSTKTMPGLWFTIFETLAAGILINISLGVFNLIPFPPLDGSWILKASLTQKLNMLFSRIQPYGFLLLIVAVHFNLLKILFYPIFILIGFVNILMGLCL